MSGPARIRSLASTSLALSVARLRAPATWKSSFLRTTLMSTLLSWIFRCTGWTAGLGLPAKHMLLVTAQHLQGWTTDTCHQTRSGDNRGTPRCSEFLLFRTMLV